MLKCWKYVQREISYKISYKNFFFLDCGFLSVGEEWTEILLSSYWNIDLIFFTQNLKTDWTGLTETSSIFILIVQDYNLCFSIKQSNCE